MPEFLVVLQRDATIAQMSDVIAAIRSRGGTVTHRYPPRVLLGQGADDVLGSLLSVAGVERVAAASVDNPDRMGLDEAGLLAVLAWNQRMSPASREMKASRVDEGAPWDFHQQRPGGDVVPVEDAHAPLARSPIDGFAPPVNTSRYMIGTVAVGVVIVDGPAGGSAAFTLAERTNVVAEVQDGANILMSLAPAGAALNFVFDVTTVTLALDPATVAGEGDWRDPAMAVLGYGAGSSGMYDYLHVLRTKKWPALCPGPDWAYVAFFTKYAVSWFAYASIGGPRLVMQYSNDGWGPTQIDRVFAHESGHIFGAADEYSSSSCNTAGSWGYLGVANGNCEVGNPGSVACLMKGNTSNVCSFTVGQFGWRDLDSDGIPDPIDLSPGTYATNVGISPGAPFYNNADLWIRNADDGEAITTHQNPRAGIDNYIYARVRNTGGVTAEVMRTKFYLANFTGTEFVYPGDYTNLITAPDTPCPVVFGLTPGASAISKVHLRPAQIPPATWHPCLLVHVQSAQEAPVAAGAHVWDTNNLAQKNLVVDYASPSQTLTLPLVLQNITAERPYFEIIRTAVPKTVKLQVQFPDVRVRPELIPLPEVARPLPEVVRPQLVTPRLGRFGAEGTAAEPADIQFIKDADVAVRLREREEELIFHLTAGSEIRFNGHANGLTNGTAEEGAAPFQRWDRVFLPVKTETVTRFQLDLPRQQRKIAAVSITVPADARIGDEYQFDLVQYNERGEQVGGIAYLIRVAKPELTLREYQWRIKVLRDLGLRTQVPRFDDLAQVTEGLVAQYVAGGGGSAAAESAHDEFAALLRESSTAAVWDQPVGGLREAAGALERGPEITADLNAVALLLSQAQERLLAEVVDA